MSETHTETHNLLHVESDRLPATLAARLMRSWIPGTLCLLGIVLLVVSGFSALGVSAFAAFFGAGSATWLTNFLGRLGVSGDEARALEQLDRDYLAVHGHWPDEE